MRQFSLLCSAGLLLVAVLFALTQGQFSLSWDLLVNPTQDAQLVLWNIRLPRILVAMLVGLSLSAAGATYQGMFKNPLVSPDILGVTAGAGLGAVGHCGFFVIRCWDFTVENPF